MTFHEFSSNSARILTVETPTTSCDLDFSHICNNVIQALFQPGHACMKFVLLIRVAGAADHRI